MAYPCAAFSATAFDVHVQAPVQRLPMLRSATQDYGFLHRDIIERILPDAGRSISTCPHVHMSTCPQHVHMSTLCPAGFCPQCFSRPSVSDGRAPRGWELTRSLRPQSDRASGSGAATRQARTRSPRARRARIHETNIRETHTHTHISGGPVALLQAECVAAVIMGVPRQGNDTLHGPARAGLGVALGAMALSVDHRSVDGVPRCDSCTAA